MTSNYWRAGVVTLVLAMLVPACAAPPSDAAKGKWQEVLYQAFQTGALSATIILHEQTIRVPMGWDSLPEPAEPDKRWTMARWDGGNDRRRVERTYLVTNANGLPGCWLTKILSYEVGPEFELQCIMLNYGTPAALTMRVVDDDAVGYEATLNMGVESEQHQIRRIIKPRSVRIDGEEKVVEAELTKVVAKNAKSLPVMNNLQWYRPKLSYKDGQLILSLDDQEVLRVKAEARKFTTVQFMSPQRIFLDDFEMWGSVQ